MQQLRTFLHEHDVFTADPADQVEHGVYLASLRKQGEAVFFIYRDEQNVSKHLVMVSKSEDVFPEFPGQREMDGKYLFAVSPLIPEAAQFLRREFPFTAPISLHGKDATIGTGDRLGIANPAHIKAVREYDIFPVLAQQSIRELNFTQRAYSDVLDAATFAVFQEGYEDGFGFDGDHLKTMEEINMALDCGATMITLDLSEVMNAEAATWPEESLKSHYQNMPQTERERLERTYLHAPFTLQDGTELAFDMTELQRCVVMYLDAVNFAKDVYEVLLAHRGEGHFDFEMSIDETEAPTVPQHHLFIIHELIHREVRVESLAPRFVGEFQKAIDYIGDIEEFERQFDLHCQIARTYGNYKISIHSGSDKFSVYPAIGRRTQGRLHVKTAGTSWLEAIRVIALKEPALYREIHQVALDSYEEALKFYHITADFQAIPPLDEVEDTQLPGYLDRPESRQLLHIIYGFVMQRDTLGPQVYSALARHEDLHYQLLEAHLRKHVERLGRPKKS